MPSTSTPPIRHAVLLSAAVAALALSACGREAEPQSAGEKLDATVADVQRKADAAGERIAEGAAELKQDVRDAAADATAAVNDAAADASTAVNDAAITAKVNAALAKDAELSALRIDVDTVDGRVALEGSAPSAAARDRAASLARAVDGVTDVDNRLTVDAG
jgi:hypothetical protein